MPQGNSNQPPQFQGASWAAFDLDQTIVAQATPGGSGGIGIIRISGPQAWQVGKAVFRPARQALLDNPRVQHLAYGLAFDPENHEPIDEVLCVFFKAPHSYTTQDVVEIQAHGGPAVLKRILEVCQGLGCRLARPGEFTQRAFMGGRLDLDQAEAVGRLISAQSQSEARLALSSLRSGLAQRLGRVRTCLVEAAAAVEVSLDFPDEVEEIVDPGLAARLEEEVIASLNKIMEDYGRRRVYSQGSRVVFCGRPNVGKSSLFNAILGAHRAIVSPHPGTTRDMVEATVLLNGIAVTLVDTAGLGDSHDEVELLGMELTRQALEGAELALLVVDGSQPLQDSDRRALETALESEHLVVINKAELPLAWSQEELSLDGERALAVSVKTQTGLEALIGALTQALAKGEPEPRPGQVVATARQVKALHGCLKFTGRAIDIMTGPNFAMELASVELQGALAALSEVDGFGAPDEVIDAVFSKFCIGK